MAMTQSENPLARDLDHILAHTPGLWEEIRGKRIFITGGTGFFGCWLLESFCWANDKLALNASATVLTRNLDAFKRKAPHLTNHPAIQFHIGDVRSFDFPTGEFSHIIHAATETNVKLDNPSPLLMFETSVEGTRRVLEFARVCRASKFLLTSSGAVYGKQPPEITHVIEDYVGAPDPVDLKSAYGTGKRVAEFLCSAYSKSYGIKTKLARCFAFVGPYLPLDSGFAIGNFIRDALQGKSIQINGDGTPCRSYLYSADLAIWLWTILLKGQSARPYNVGSENEITIKDLALAVRQVLPNIDMKIAHASIPGNKAERYIPSTKRAHDELRLNEFVGLHDAIKRTVDWYSLIEKLKRLS